MKMKNTVLICALMIISFTTRAVANPIEVHQALISELLFDENDHWILEIIFDTFGGFSSEDYDSICMRTSNGISKLKLNSLKDGDYLIVINSDSLTTPLPMNRNGDRVELISYPKVSSGYSYIDGVAFGDYPGSMFDSLQIGYSICRIFSEFFCKDKSPTIGFPNDTSGTYGTLQGFMYDFHNHRIANGTIFPGAVTPFGDKFVFQPDGSFSMRVYSCKTCILTLYSGGHTASIDSLCFDVEPDSVVWRDIHIRMNFPYGIPVREDYRNYELSIINYPNPFNSITNFSIIIPQSLQHQKGNIKIFNVAGQEIKNIDILLNSTAQWNGTDNNGFIQPTGVYYYQLIFDNRVYKNGSMILLK
ncbi:MAG: T9SS type A sorting domain-containing protein [Bacteroidota bacterium]